MNKNIHGSSMYNSKITAKVSTNSRMAKKKKKLTYSYKKQVVEGSFLCNSFHLHSFNILLRNKYALKLKRKR